MVIESRRQLIISEIIQVADYEFTSNPKIPGKVIREVTFEEYKKDVLPNCSEEEKDRYKHNNGYFHYEVLVD